jgi:single-stranded-DNA-specific exonuclease
MGQKFTHWTPATSAIPSDLGDVTRLLLDNRRFVPRDRLEYGDHGLERALDEISSAITSKQTIALYADYDVDGVMSCVSWIWFLRAIGHSNVVHHIPDRMTEGYGVNMTAVRRLVEEKNARLIITMDTGVTAQAEAAWARAQGVSFVCTDHHTIQPDKIPDCALLNPKLHPDPDYQELCGCGITFVLLRRLAQRFPVPAELWTDLLALVGMATVCDVVPLNGVNHRLVRQGVDALMKSRRLVFSRLREASRLYDAVDETDIGFQMGPRINAVGRLEHAHTVVQAFISEDPEPLIRRMGVCNDERREIQKRIVEEAMEEASRHTDEPMLFLGGAWHPGVVGIAASKVAEAFWKPTWLFERKGEACKGSARSIEGFNVTEAMTSAAALFDHYGGHRAAGGFRFATSREGAIREALVAYATARRSSHPELWQSRLRYDFQIPNALLGLPLAESIHALRPFGHGFEAPRFLLEATPVGRRIIRDKASQTPKHTLLTILDSTRREATIKLWNTVSDELQAGRPARFIVSPEKDTYRGVTSLGLRVHDWSLAT